MQETPVVVNFFTKSDWAAKLQDAFKTRQEVILLGIPAEPERVREINKLCEAAGYTSPESLPEDQWAHYQEELNLTGMAAKEQPIAPNAISVSRPR